MLPELTDTDRESERERQRERERHTNRETKRETETETERQRMRQSMRERALPPELGRGGSAAVVRWGFRDTEAREATGLWFN